MFCWKLPKNRLFRPFFQNFPNRIFQNTLGVLPMRFDEASLLVAILRHFFLGTIPEGRRVRDARSRSNGVGRRRYRHKKLLICRFEDWYTSHPEALNGQRSPFPTLVFKQWRRGDIFPGTYKSNVSPKTMVVQQAWQVRQWAKFRE